jgi:ABC-type lipoprotein release transport system permease subunit
VTTTVLRETAAVVGIGLLAGPPLAFAAGTALRTYLFNVEAHDTSVVAGACLAVCVAALAAAWLPAGRATRVDPARVLRAE